VTFMPDIDRMPHTHEDALTVHTHKCPECGTSYQCNCSQNDRKESVVCTVCERAGN
jgi:hypothetical protein